MRSSPPDTNSYSRPAVAEDFDPLNAAGTADPGKAVQFDVFVVDTVVNNTDLNLQLTDTFNDGEISIAVRPQHPEQLVITAFSGSWGLRAPLWRSRNRGNTWTKEFTVNPPPGVGGVPGCPCDQTVDFTQFRDLAGAFLTFSPDNIYSALNRNPAALTFNYFESAPGVAQAANHLDGVNDVDQPWLLVGPQPGTSGENVYVAYDNFLGAPDMHVAVATATSPLNFTTDNISGFSTGFINPGHRRQSTQAPVRSTAYFSAASRLEQGAHRTSTICSTAPQTAATHGVSTAAQPASLLPMPIAHSQPEVLYGQCVTGGVDHAAVDPQTGDVVYVYGNRDANTGNNRLAMRRLTDDGAGGLAIGPEIFITGQVQAAIPSVAVTDKGTIGIFYYTCDGTSLTGFPIFTAHLAVSTDQGATFSGVVLETFLFPRD
jgi:hypothetical protein